MGISKRETERCTNDHRVLLVEFVNADQFPGRISHLFPFVRGYLAELGVPTRWLRFGVSTTNQLRHGRDEVTLDEAELQTLLGATCALQPTLILIDDPLHPPQQDAVCEAAPGVEIRPQRDWSFFGLEGQRPFAGTQELRRADFVPRYCWEPGNGASQRQDIDNVYIEVRHRCGHPRPLAGNARYAAVEGVNRHLGCTFCPQWIEAADGEQPVETPLGAPESTWISRQINSLARDRCERKPSGLLLESIAGSDVLQLCLDAMQEARLDDVKLWFAVRTDQVPRVDRLVRRYFADRPNSSVRLGVYACGVESFVEEDLDLFNKGTTTLDGLRAVNLLRSLAGQLPGRFTFTGLTFILCSPWTTPEALLLNLGLIRLLRLNRKEAGNLFQARLRLHPRLPITHLAVSERLVREDDENNDPAARMNRRKLFRSERPWRCADPRLNPVVSLFSRFELVGSELADPLTKKLEGSLRKLNANRRYGDAELLQFLIAMAEQARETPHTLGEDELLAHTTIRVAQQRAARASPSDPRRYRLGLERVALPELVTRVVRVLGKDSTQIVVLRNVLPAEVSADVEAIVSTRGFALRRTPSNDRESLLLGTSAAVIERWRMAHESWLAGDRAAATTMGGLLGLPDCCAAATEGGVLVDTQELSWRAFAARLGCHTGKSMSIAPLWVPAQGFVPCTPDCPAATSHWNDRFAVLEVEPPAPGTTAYLFSLGSRDDGDLVPLHVLESSDDSLYYDPEHLPRDDSQLVTRLASGRCLEMLPGQLRIAADGRIVEPLTVSHAIWHSQRVWHREEWLELARSALSIAARSRTLERQEEIGSSFARRVMLTLNRARLRLARQTGFELVSLERSDDGVRVQLARGTDTLDLDIEPAQPYQPAFRRGRNLAISYRSHAPPDTPTKTAAIDQLLRLLDQPGEPA